MRPTKEVYLSLLFAFIAIVFVLLTILLVWDPTNAISLNDKLMVSALFIASCCVGISLALYPGWLRRRSRPKQTTVAQEPPNRSFSGHHPDCEKFQTHRLTIGEKTWCAGCLGLLVGSVISIFFMILYAVSSPGFSRLLYESFLLIGLVLIVVIFVETIVKNRNSTVHVLFNILLILGFFFITMSVSELTGKGLYGVFTVLLCTVWLNTRVTLSTWRHRSTCSYCNESCKMYAPAWSSVSK